MLKKSILQSAGTVFLAGSLALVTLTSCKKDSTATSPPPSNTIANIVSTNTSFSILKAAVVKADLATTLSGTGPFTVFAPNDAAFTASGITLASINTLSADELKKILLYHTLSAKVISTAVPAGPNAPVTTVNGDPIYVTRNNSGVFVNGIKVQTADVAADNGIIHVLDRVLLPAKGNLVEVAQGDTTFSFLVAAVLRASSGNTDVVAALSGTGPFTVFAPTNNAFRAAGFSTINDVSNADPNTLASILTYHVVAGRVFSSDLSDGAQPATLNGANVTIGLTSGATVRGNSNASPSNITAANILATNGVVHVIDRVLLP